MNVRRLHVITPQLALIWLTNIIVLVSLDTQEITVKLVRNSPMDHVK